MILIATPGAVDANSYCTVAEAYTLLSPTLYPALLTDDMQIQLGDALIWATRLINEQVLWTWRPVTTTQALPWPQLSALSPGGQTLSSTAIPDFLKRATAEYALLLLQAVAQQRVVAAAATRLQGLKRLAIDDVQMEAHTTAGLTMGEQASTIPAATHMPLAIRRQLLPYGEVAGGQTVRLVRT